MRLLGFCRIYQRSRQAGVRGGRDGGRLTSDRGILLLAAIEQR
jgi:hypothetical protein